MKQETAPRYEVVDELGRDPATQIHHCRLRGIEGFEKDVVIKRIAPQRRMDGALVRLFLDEARLLAKVSHPNIAQVFEVGHGAEGPYLVMEYVKGVELAQVAARARHAPHVPYGHLARLVAGLCDAVTYAEALLRGSDDNHDFRVDLELANIVISREGGAKLLDFGRLRRAGLPGVKRAEAPDQVHVIGRMLFDLTTARREGIDPDVTAVVPSDMVGDYPRELERVVLSTLHARKPDRPTLPEIRDLLEEFATLPRYRSNASALTSWLRDLFPELAPPSRPHPLGHETTAITVAGGPQAENARRERTPTTTIHRMGRRRRAGVAVALGATALLVAGGVVLFRLAGSDGTPPAETSVGAASAETPRKTPPETTTAAPAMEAPPARASDHEDEGAAPTGVPVPTDNPALAAETSAARAGATSGKGGTRPRATARTSASDEPRPRRRAHVHATGMDFDEDPWPNRPATEAPPATDRGADRAAAARAPTADRKPSADHAPSADPGALTAARLAPAPAPRLQAAAAAPTPPRPRATVPIPTLPRIHVADDPEQLARTCHAVETAVVTVAGVSAAFARGATDRLCRSVPAHAPIYPIAMYYFLVREAALEHDSNAASANLEAAHASGVIVRYKDLPGIEPAR